MPVCNECWKSSWVNWWTIAALSELIWFVGLTLLIFGTESKSMEVYSTMAALALVPTLLTLKFIPQIWVNPAEVVQNSSSKEFRFRFANPEYSELTLNAIRQRDRQK